MRGIRYPGLLELAVGIGRRGLGVGGRRGGEAATDREGWRGGCGHAGGRQGEWWRAWARSSLMVGTDRMHGRRGGSGCVKPRIKLLPDIFEG